MVFRCSRADRGGAAHHRGARRAGAHVRAASGSAVRARCGVPVRPGDQRAQGTRVDLGKADGGDATVNTQIVTMPVPAQDGITSDNGTVRVDAVVYFKVIDPVRATTSSAGTALPSSSKIS